MVTKRKKKKNHLQCQTPCGCIVGSPVPSSLLPEPVILSPDGSLHSAQKEIIYSFKPDKNVHTMHIYINCNTDSLNDEI